MDYLKAFLLFTIFSICYEAEAQRVLVISGGGARGAWGGGIAEHLVLEKDADYQAIIGTSTGSLMAPLVAVEDFTTLNKMYTGVKQKSIFNVNPFKVKRKQGEVVSIKLKFLKAIFRIIFGKKTLGESKNLRRLIMATYDLDRYENILSQGDPFFVTVTNFSNAEMFYFNSQQEAFDSRQISCEGLSGKNLRKCLQQKDQRRQAMLDWIWRSANQPLFMTLDCTSGEVTDGDNSVSGPNCWVDGGVRENIPLLRGIAYILDQNPQCTGSPSIDVIINNRQVIDLEPIRRRRILTSLFRTVNILTFDVRESDISLPTEVQNAYNMEMGAPVDPQQEPYIAVNLHFMKESTYQQHPWDLYFNAESMSKLWEAGKNFEVDLIEMKISREVAQLLIKEGRESKKL